MKTILTLLKTTIIIIALLLTTNVYSQGSFTAGQEITLKVPRYCLIETNHAPVNLNFEVTEAGKHVEEVTNSDVFVRMSSRTPGVTSREITFSISSGTIPAGTTLTLTCADCTTANSGGDVGIAYTDPKTVSYNEQYIVYEIKDGWTGPGYNDGYQITFTWTPVQAANYQLLKAGISNMTVIFTLTESSSDYNP